MTEALATEQAASQAVVEQPKTRTLQVDEMSDKQRERWLRTGQDTVKIQTEAADSSPAKTADQNTAASEAGTTHEGTSAEQPGRQDGKRKNASDRKEELSADIKDLLEKRGVLKSDEFWGEFEEYRKHKGEKKAESPAALLEATETAPPERPKRPRLSEYANTVDYEAAMDTYDDAMLAYPAQKAAYESVKAQADKAKTEIAEHNKRVEEKWKADVAKAQEKHTDFNDVAFAKDLPIKANSPVDEWILLSEVGADMLYHFGKNRDELAKINAMSRPAQHRELAKLEEKLGGDSTVTAESVKESQTAKQEAPRAEKKVTQAPAPPREVGGTATVAEDPITAAVKADDFDAFQNAANARDLQRRKRGR